MAGSVTEPTREWPAPGDPNPSPVVMPLADASRCRLDEVGGKAARLGEMVAAGLPVPPAVVVPPATLARADGARIAAVEAVRILGPGPVAVRSSAVAEDLADASYAGLYDSVLDVNGVDAVASAIESVARSADNDRVASYEAAHRDATVAVLVQTMVPAECAGVAFTAHPVTGDRDEVVVAVVDGLGDRLVSGDVNGETWIVRDGVARPDGTVSVLGADEVRRVAALARSIDDAEGAPQDVEWAMAAGQLWLLQARPMTALPEPVEWTATVKNPFLRREFRCGEWLPDPVTPLFETWYLPNQDAGLERAQRTVYGGGLRAPFHDVVNGWYYSGIGTPNATVLAAALRHPVYTAKWAIAFHQTGRSSILGDLVMGRQGYETYRTKLLPVYRDAVVAAEASVEGATPEELVDLTDGVAHASGFLMFAVVDCAGFGWKAEATLVAFCNAHLPGRAPGEHQQLVAGLRLPAPTPRHAVANLDWIHPTAGESGAAAMVPDLDRHAALVARREVLEAEYRAELADRPTLLARFDRFLGIAQRAAMVREEIVADLTLGWPVMRRACRRLGDELAATHAIDHPDDVFWLTRATVVDEISGHRADRRDGVTAARARWERQRRLSPPDWIGKPAPIYDRLRAAFGLGEHVVGALVTGIPASAGRATGPVRIITSIDQFDRVEAGDVLVTRVTAPAWTPLFARVAAVVTDLGSLAAHASLIAREYGIPAVVGTRSATTTLVEGATVTVDGTTGSVLAAE